MADELSDSKIPLTQDDRDRIKASGEIDGRVMKQQVRFLIREALDAREARK